MNIRHNLSQIEIVFEHFSSFWINLFFYQFTRVNTFLVPNVAALRCRTFSRPKQIKPFRCVIFFQRRRNNHFSCRTVSIGCSWTINNVPATCPKPLQKEKKKKCCLRNYFPPLHKPNMNSSLSSLPWAALGRAAEGNLDNDFLSSGIFQAAVCLLAQAKKL